MNWDVIEVGEYDFTILVTDIRGGTAPLAHCPARTARDFIREFTDLTDFALDQATIGSPVEYQINNFLGDGFLIFLADPDDHKMDKRGPAIAARAARRMRSRFNALCRSPDFRGNGFEDMGLIAGINYGRVLFGPFNGPTIRRATGIVDNVIFAFRLAQHADFSEILVSEAIDKDYLPDKTEFPTQRDETEFRGLGRRPFFRLLDP